jgi:hypothetical protein
MDIVHDVGHTSVAWSLNYLSTGNLPAAKGVLKATQIWNT